MKTEKDVTSVKTVELTQGCKQIEATLLSLRDINGEPIFWKTEFERNWQITQLHLRMLEYAQISYDINVSNYVRVMIESSPFIFPDIKALMLEDIRDCFDPRLSERRCQVDPHKYHLLLNLEIEKAQSSR